MYRGVLLSAPPWLVYYEPTNVYHLLVYYYFMANGVNTPEMPVRVRYIIQALRL